MRGKSSLRYLEPDARRVNLLSVAEEYSGNQEAQVTRTIALVQINNASRQHIIKNEMNRLFNKAQLTSFPVALQTKLQMIPRRRSHSKVVLRQILPPNIYNVPYRASRNMEISGEIRISAPKRDIEKIIAFSGIFDLSTRSGV
ncbi:hypothetical protein AVEN_117841-1 [Araneus ventricosus]|uniref:Uncharacterized protein n=1 Tax=Araneus ventricosus TaxID=182803 RepID=A0A4Y2NKF4_ARAVE|nr:hypothetical protein AVEN_117841-1 [Araneus ventricosus]